MTSLHVICGLGPPPIKNPGYAYATYHVFVKPTNLGRIYIAQGP